MSMKTAQKIAYAVDGIMLTTNFALMVFFKMIEVDFLYYFGIPTAVVFISALIMVRKEMLEAYLWTIYGWLVLYICVTTVCIGEDYGFHLYCFSMIPVVFVVEYMSFKLGRTSIKSLFISICVAFFCILFLGYVKLNGPIFETDEKYAPYLWLFNTITVFAYLVVYANYLIHTIISTEKKLSEMAHIDRLTGLFNRHYMLDKLNVFFEDGTQGVLAIADIDDFKKINDTYGHNAGDEVLKTVSAKMKNICKDCVISRWGGEEFLILCPVNKDDGYNLLESMRLGIGSEPVVFEESSIKVSVTVGMSGRESNASVGEWIHLIDMKLYEGKKSGKNRVVV